MNVFLKQIRPQHEVFRCRIAAGQRFTIGGSELANRRISSVGPLPDVCVILEVSDTSCTLVNAVSGRVVVKVNGQPAQFTTLKNQDKIQIGSALFTVTWTEVIPAIQPEIRIEVVPSYNRKFIPSGLWQYVPGRQSWPLSSIVEQLSSKLTPVLFVNMKAAALRPPDVIVSLPNYYENAPDEIRETNSLQAIAAAPIEALLKLYQPLHAHDAAIWAFTAGAPESALNDAKLFLPWFARPSILKLHLDKGSKMFVQGLTKPFAAFCFRYGTDREWLVYTRPEKNWSDIGLHQPPAITN